ncbi:mucin-2-like isoform X2 [Lampris incognitus]|uniref:mucin-2-like isoform X2 n=1 Tax=Lampris incognitus TaxID=2546036 RepID=UPI0024B5E4B3|nr:mucin-2-like isoform X2 [Lampris incognitus]
MCSSLASTENQSTCEKVDVLISCLNSSSEGAESNVSPKRRRISKIKPNVGFPSRNTQSKSQLTEDSSNLSKSESMNSSSSTSSEQHSTKDNNTCELNTIQKADMHLTSPHSSSNTERVNLAQPKAIESEIPFEANTTPDTRTSDPVVTETCAIEDSFTVTKSVHETQSSDTSVIGGTVTGNTSAIEAKDTETVPHLPVESSVMQKNIQTQRRCFSKVKPKPNLCQAIRNKKPNPCPTKDTMRKSNPEVLERTSEICPEKQKNEEPGVHSDPQIGKDYSMPAIPTQSPSSSEQSSSVVPSAASGLHSSESNFCPSIMKNSAISETLMAIEDQFVMRDYDLLPQNSNEFTEIKPSDKPTTMEDNIKGLEQPALHVVEVSKETLPHQTTWGRFSKAKPRLQHKPVIRTTQPQPIEDTHLHEEPEPCQTESQPSLGTDTTESSDKKEQHSTVRPVPSAEHQFPKSTDEVHALSDDSEKLSGGISCRTMSSDHINEVSWLIENPFLMIDTNDSQMSTTAPAPAGQPSSTQDKVEAESTPLELKSQATDGPNPISKSMSLIGDSLQSKLQPLLNTNAYSTADPKESSQHLCLESSSDIVMVDIHVKDHDDLQHLPESSETNQTATDNSQDAHIGDDALLQPLDSNPSAKKAPPARRARLSRPKPNLRCSSQLSHRKPVQTATQPEPVSATCSEAQEEAASQRPDSTPDANSPGPVNAATIGCVEIDNPSNSAAIALDCMIEMPSISIQDAAAEDSGCSESIPVLTGHSDVLSEEVPPNPEEPFFILSLTEIPVFPSGEEMESVSEPIPYLPATDETVQLQSGLATPEGSSNVGEDQALCDVLVPMPTEEADERGFSSVNEVEPAITTCKSVSHPDHPSYQRQRRTARRFARPIERKQNSKQKKEPNCW